MAQPLVHSDVIKIKGGVNILTLPACDRPLSSPDVNILLENFDTGRKAFFRYKTRKNFLNSLVCS